MQELGALRINLSLTDGDFTKSVTGINRKLRGLNSEFKATTESNKGFESSLDTLRRKQDNLGSALSLHKQKVEQLRKEYDRSVEAKGKDAKETENLLVRYNKALTTMSKVENELNDVTQEVNKQSNAWNKLGDNLKNSGDKIKRLGSSMRDTGRNLTMSVSAPIVGLGAAIVKTGADFEEGMSKVSAVSGATGQTLEQLEEQAKELGATTKFSASEASEGMQYLAMAGFDANEIMKAMPGLLDLAASGALDLGRAADIASNIMSGFAIDASKSGHVSDVLAKAAASANTNVEQLGTAMGYLAPVSNALGWSLEEATSAVMALSDAGLQGEKAGAAFSTSLTRLTSPSKEAAGVISDLGFEFFTAEGNMKSMPNVMKEIEKGTKGLTKEQKAAALSTVFGQEAYKHWAVLLEKGSDQLGKNANMLEKADGAAKKMADTMNKNTKGAFKEFKSALEGAGIALSETLLPLVTTGVKKLTGLARSFSDLSPETKKLVLGLGGLAIVVPPLIAGAGLLASGIGSIVTVAGMASGAIAGAGGLGAALATVATGPIGLTVAAIAGLTVGGIALAKQMNESAIEVKEFGDEVSESTKKAVNSYLELDEQATIALNELAWSQQTVTEEMASNLISTFDQMGDQVLAEMKEDHATQLETVQSFFSQRAALSQEEEATILEKQIKFQQQQEEQVQISQDRIQGILNTAKEEKRALTEAERIEIAGIQNKMKETAVQVMSESEAEQKAILETMKVNASELSAQQAAEVVKNATAQKEKVVSEAKQQYTDTVGEIIKMRDESGIISAEQADKLIAEATKQRDSVITRAEETHAGVVEQAQKQAKEHIDLVDWETGEVLSKWDVLSKKTAIKVGSMVGKTLIEFHKMKKGISVAGDLMESYFSRKMGDLRTGAVRKLAELGKDFSDFKDRITGFFTRMVLKIPKIRMPKLPHFSVSGGFDLMPPDISVPRISVNWYKDGGLFPANSPRLVGIGDASVPEAALPLSDSVMSLLASKITDHMPKNVNSVSSNARPIVNVYLGDQEIKDVIQEYIEDEQDLRHFRDQYTGGLTK